MTEPLRVETAFDVVDGWLQQSSSAFHWATATGR